jgi:hypothetical protein
MILMVRDYPAEYIIDDLEFVRVEQLYYISKESNVYYRETFKGNMFNLHMDDTTSLFVPRDKYDDDAEYQLEPIGNELSEEKVEVCVANAVCALKNGVYRTYIIHPSLNAYLCNNDGKTIRVIR